ncbi:MAG: energy transducer TonB, partial [Chloroflexota bacterium]|nr:energy transducer TonB [Chloroflexota bacterium]
PEGWPPQSAYKPGDGVALPKVLRETKPRYTRAAMQAGIQGTVLLEVVVEKDGFIRDAIVTRSLDQTFGLDLEALNAARQWQFVAGTRMGKPVPVLATIELTFVLR